MRILQAIVDVTAEAGWWSSCVAAMNAIQCIIQGRWEDEDPLLQLPGVDEAVIQKIKRELEIQSLNDLVQMYNQNNAHCCQSLNRIFDHCDNTSFLKVLGSLPYLAVECKAHQEGNEIKLVVQLKRLNSNRSRKKMQAPRAYTPCFPKLKEEAWWVAATDKASNQLLALKRISFGDQASVSFSFSEQSIEGLLTTKSIVIHTVCDSYIGLDLCIPA